METYSYGIDFFSDSFLESEVAALVERARKSVNANLFKNVVDPYAVIFEAAAFGGKVANWQTIETSRQANKTLANAIGDFHQSLLGNLPGWESTGRAGGGLDLIHPTPFGSQSTPAFAEVKNKYNTMNSGGILSVFTKFQNFLSMPDYKRYTCYLIQVIQKQPRNDIPWLVSQRGPQENIRIIGAPYVYQLSTGDSAAFAKTLRAVLQILQVKHGFEFDGEDERELTEILRNAPGFTQ